MDYNTYKDVQKGPDSRCGRQYGGARGMTRKFAMQCCITGREADMLLEMLDILGQNMDHVQTEMICGYPSGNVFVGMTGEHYKRLGEISSHFGRKLENLPAEENG